jgi:hypothetical protein
VSLRLLLHCRRRLCPHTRLVRPLLCVCLVRLLLCARLVLLLLRARLPLACVFAPATPCSWLVTTRREGSPWTSPQALAHALALVVARLPSILPLLLRLLLLHLPVLLVVLVAHLLPLLAPSLSSSTQTTRSLCALPCVVPVLPRLCALWAVSPPLLVPPLARLLLLLLAVPGAGRAIARPSTTQWTPRNAARQSGLSAGVSTEEAEVTPAMAADVPAFGPAPTPGAGRSRASAAGAAPATDASAPAGRGFRRCPAWVPVGHELPAPNPLGPAEAGWVVLRSDVAERVVRQGPVVPCIRCLERWQQDPMEPCQPTHPGAHAYQKCSGRHQGCVLVRFPSTYWCWVC